MGILKASPDQELDEKTVVVLDRTMIFGELELPLKEKIASLLERKYFKQGDEIVLEDTPADGLYIVRKGHVSVVTQNKDLRLSLQIALLGPDDVFGEMALLTGEKRGATVKAKSDVICDFLSEAAFQKVIRQVPSISIGIARTLAHRLNEQNKSRRVEFKKLSNFRYDPEIYSLIPDPVLRKHKAVPLLLEGNDLTLAMVSPEDPIAMDELARGLHRINFKPVAVSESDYQHFMTTYVGQEIKKPSVTSLRRTAVDPGKVELYNATEDQKLAQGVSGEEVIKLLNTLIAEALENNASDIHIGLNGSSTSVKFRVDGILHEKKGFIPSEYCNPLISRLKVLARLDPTEKMLPQDGRISMKYDGRDYDLRVATIPIRRGERATMRVLDSGSNLLDTKRLFLAAQVVRVVEQMIFKPQGLTLITGPTGSGKTTTMYSLLKTRLAHDGSKISVATIEDPIEYTIPGIAQTEINPSQNMSFDVALRSILRHDPDLIMVGETRDASTANTVCQAALTGHSVITSMHTNNALESIMRLEDLGVQKAMVVSSLNGIIAQRLVRRNCPNCSVPKKLPAAVLANLEDRGLIKRGSDLRIMEGKGCRSCQGTGFQGRIGVYEVLPVSDTLKDAISSGATRKETLDEALKSNMITMKNYAYFLLKKGLTTPAEIIRILG